MNHEEILTRKNECDKTRRERERQPWEASVTYRIQHEIYPNANESAVWRENARSMKKSKIIPQEELLCRNSSPTSDKGNAVNIPLEC